MPPRQKSHLSGRLGSLSARRKASSTAGVSDASEERVKEGKVKFRSPTPKFFKKVKSRSPCDLVAFRFIKIKSSLLPLILLRPIGIYSSRDEMRRFCAAQQTMRRRRRRRRMRNKRNGAKVPAPLCVAYFILTCFFFGGECTEDVSISDPAEIVSSPEFNFGISVNVMGRGTNQSVRRRFELHVRKRRRCSALHEMG